MNMPTLIKTILHSLALIGLLTACTPADIPLRGLEKDQERLEEIMIEIETLIADKSCSDQGACQVIAYGAKACGGPAGYLVYASGNVDEQQLEDLVDAYTELQIEMIEAYNLSSDCSLPTEPSPECLSGQCQ